MQLKLPYGKKNITAEVPDNTIRIYPKKQDGLVSDERETIRVAMESTIGSERLVDIARKKLGKNDKVAIVINDITRPSPSKLFVQEIWKELEEAGVSKGQVTIVIATGKHRLATEEELNTMLGEDLVSVFRIISSDCKDDNSFKYFGETSRGLPVYINRYVTEAKLKILTGVIAPHHIAGYSGGRKSVVPGVASFETIQKHHSPPIRPLEPMLGVMDNNFFHDESVEAAEMINPDYIVNVVKNSDDEIVHCVAGHFYEAHMLGTNYCREVWEVPIPCKADIAIVSPGGYPHDIDLHQSQKAVSVAELVLKPGGIIILIAECPNRDGTDFLEVLENAESPKQVIDEFKEKGVVGNEGKAFMFARALDKHKIFVITDNFTAEEMTNAFFEKANSVQEVFEKVLNAIDKPTIMAFPYGNDTLPELG